MITAPEDRGWWIAADGNWYPPESHPDAEPTPVSGEPGWWLASDGLWYPPESHPDAPAAPPLEVPDSDGTTAEWTEMLATFAAFETRPRETGSVPSSLSTAPRRRGLIAVSLIVTLAVAASVIGFVATSGPGAPSKPAVTGWTDHSLRVVGTPVAGDGKVLFLDVSPTHDLHLAAVNPANGSVRWTMPFSPSGITPGVQFGPVIVQNVALDLAPAGNAKDAGVYLKGIDVGTGKVIWSVPQPVEATDPPQACNNDHDFCVPVWDTQTTTALVALDAVDGQPVFATEGPYRNLSESAPGNANRGGIWQTSDSAPTFTWVDANGQRTWTRSLSDLFGGSQYGPDNGYNFALDGGVNVGSVGVASSGNTTPLNESKTVGIRAADGSVAWSVPGDFMCGGSLQFLTTDLVCQYTGSAQTNGHTTTISGGMVLRGLDPATGTLTWSSSVGQPTELSNGQDVAFADATHLVVQTEGGRRMVLDTEDGSLAPVGRSQVFWCEEDPLYKVNASTDGSVNGERASAAVFTACSASGARLDAQPTTRPSTVGVTIDGYFVWPSTDGLHSVRTPATS